MTSFIDIHSGYYMESGTTTGVRNCDLSDWVTKVTLSWRQQTTGCEPSTRLVAGKKRLTARGVSGEGRDGAPASNPRTHSWRRHPRRRVDRRGRNDRISFLVLTGRCEWQRWGGEGPVLNWLTLHTMKIWTIGWLVWGWGYPAVCKAAFVYKILPVKYKTRNRRPKNWTACTGRERD